MFDENFFVKAWYRGHPVVWLLLPLAWIYCVSVVIRKKLYDWHVLKQVKIPVPVVIVGNITVGGTGKTPLIIELAVRLEDMGLTPGIVSRGFGGKSPVWPLSVSANSNPVMVGDEPVMIARRTGCPIVVGPDRVEACKTLLHRYPDVNVILSDDGMQHYQLERDIEIALFDGARCMGNRHCLPAGPLREPPSRVGRVNEVIIKGADPDNPKMKGVRMDLVMGVPYDIQDRNKTLPLTDFKGKTMHAVVGIGNPEPFFADLRAAGINVVEHIFTDHYEFEENDVMFNDDNPIITTEKDAVKLELYKRKNIWVIPVNVGIEEDFYQRIYDKLNKLIKLMSR